MSLTVHSATHQLMCRFSCLQEMINFYVKVGHEEIPFIIGATRLTGGRAQAKNLLTHALCRPLLSAFVRNEACSLSIRASWDHRLL